MKTSLHETSSLRQRGLGKYSLKAVLGSDFYIQADLITLSQRPAQAMCHEDANNEGLPSPPAIFVVGTIGKSVGKCRVRGCIIFLASQIMSYTF